MSVSLNKSLTLAGKAGLTTAKEIVSWFSYATGLVEPDELKAQAIKLITKVLKDEYGKFEGWFGDWHYLPLPSLKYVNRGFPFIEFTIDLYLAASVDVEISYYDSRHYEFARVMKKELEKFKVPVIFLDALAEGDLKKLSQFKVIERDYSYITLDIPRFGEIKLRDYLISAFRKFLKGKKVGEAFAEAGLLPLDAGNLIDSCLRKAPALPPSTSGNYEDVLDALKGLGYSKAIAEKAAKFTIANCFEAKLEDKIKFALKYLTS